MAEVGTPALQSRPLRWYQGISRYQWWVVCVGSMAWLMDTMAQRIFILARSPALADLTGTASSSQLVKTYGGYATASMMLGWAVGGFYFGIVGDKWGRAKTLSASVLSYSLFTGLSALSMHWWDFCLYRFLMGCGIGGAFATGATLIAETVPTHSRAFALGMFQALSAAGNIFASFISGYIKPPVSYLNGWFTNGVPGWRLLFLLGALPAFLVVFILKTIKEPESFLAAKANAKDKLAKQMGDIRGMFTTPRWRRSTIVGVCLAVAGVVGLWGVGFWSPELIREALTPPEMKGMALPKVGTAEWQQWQAVDTHISEVISRGTMWQDVGAFFGMFAFTIIATRLGRKIGFGLSFAAALVVVVTVFLTLRSEWQVYFMLPLVGFVTLSVFGGYSIYFPEIYPTRLRSTGTAFCYNAARIVTAATIFLGGPLRDGLKAMGVQEPFRWGAVILCGFYLLGIAVLLIAPETKDQPLPED